MQNCGVTTPVDASAEAAESFSWGRTANFPPSLMVQMKPLRVLWISFETQFLDVVTI